QMLTAISYAVQELYHNDVPSNSNINNGALKIQQQIDLAIKEAKNIAYDLIPIVLKDFGLIVAISNLISRANETYDTKFRFDAFDFNERIDPKLEKALYRICQETVNNIIKHANAENATYQIFWQDCSIVLVIEDDGVGFNTSAQDKKEKDSGIGLISIRERVHAFNGTFTINSETGQGTEIIVEIPCRKT
ncbi:MAG: ATP-binding protein, partial [Bacteroidota bacterium]|nr:ATP-binding protein [Bacteroidota bacterium]